jgi:hypothetical protein
MERIAASFISVIDTVSWPDRLEARLLLAALLPLVVAVLSAGMAVPLEGLSAAVLGVVPLAGLRGVSVRSLRGVPVVSLRGAVVLRS